MVAGVKLLSGKFKPIRWLTARISLNKWPNCPNEEMAEPVES